jgi:oligopeptide/dipeptide ABC transporter ATP-binding protein
MSNDHAILRVSHLSTYFFTFQGIAKAVEDVSFEVYPGEILGLVGESGCGKSVSALTILQLIPMPPGKIVNGSVYFEGIDLVSLTNDQMKKIRGNKISMIFQEPSTSLNPVLTVGTQIIEPLMLHQNLSKREAIEMGIEMLKLVGIAGPAKVIHQYPHQLSGGMKQRVMIAMAISCNPKVLIADEPTTALDVTIQAQILDLMRALKEEKDLVIILISHDLGVIGQMTHRCLVMYAGKIVEEGPTDDIFGDPCHPYTQGLLDSIPWWHEEEEQDRKPLREIPGTVPDVFDLPSNCRFLPRCPKAMDICRESEPMLKRISDTRAVRCWRMGR